MEHSETISSMKRSVIVSVISLIFILKGWTTFGCKLVPFDNKTIDVSEAKQVNFLTI
jgi:hypothetical protein